MKVKTLVEHRNGFGDQELKKVDDIYELPDDHGEILIEHEICELADKPAE